MLHLSVGETRLSAHLMLLLCVGVRICRASERKAQATKIEWSAERDLSSAAACDASSLCRSTLTIEMIVEPFSQECNGGFSEHALQC